MTVVVDFVNVGRGIRLQIASLDRGEGSGLLRAPGRDPDAVFLAVLGENKGLHHVEP